MPETLFIADIHLSSTHSEVLTFFLEFLSGRARGADILYILGDLFEVWIGDDDPSYQEVMEALRLLTSQIPIFVLPGNRDFLLGEGFIKTTGCQLLPDPSLIDVYGVPTLLTHGDSLCTLDSDYQAFRRQVRDQAWQQWFLAQPLEQRRALAQQARRESQQHGKKTVDEVMEVTPQAVHVILEQYGVRRLVHGHTHHPGIHPLTVNREQAYRKVLGAWEAHQAVGLRWTPQEYHLLTLTR